MIPVSSEFDLGLDKDRIKDPSDAERQTRTVRHVLDRLYTSDDDKRWELQIVADEVGMGKTFVALGVAYSLLRYRQQHGFEGDLRSCLQNVLILTPGSTSLFEKWKREVDEFVRRCVLPEHREQARRWFRPSPVERIDELALALGRGGVGPKVVVAPMGIFSGKNLKHYDLKRRYLLGCLFRYWGAKLLKVRRARLLKGAPAAWPNNPDDLLELTEREPELLPYDADHAVQLLRKIDRPRGDRPSLVEELRQLCIEISEKGRRGRDELFKKVGRRLIRLHEQLSVAMIRRALPLVVVDEAHHWKNRKNGYEKFSQLLARKTRRLLLLTATPFQLRPDEMLELIRLGEDIRPCAKRLEGKARCERIAERRERVIAPVLENSANSSRRFSRAWSRVRTTVETDALLQAWSEPTLAVARRELHSMAFAPGVVASTDVDRIADAAVSRLDPDIRELLREALRLYAFNVDLSQEMGEFVIRHRRHARHRLFRVGNEYASDAAEAAARPDRHVLHAAPGLDVRGDGELPHYLLMRCVTEAKGGKGRSALGSSLTGCYSTLLESAEWRRIEKTNGEGGVSVYAPLLRSLVDESKDPTHPKVRQVVDALVKAWNGGEKGLVFCFRTNTAKRLRDIVDERIREQLDERRKRCLGGPKKLKSLRSRLTGRDRDLIVLGLDRVLWSWWWAHPDCGLDPARDLLLREDELRPLAALALSAGVKLSDERPDRVFLHRATEHLVAKRLLASGPRDSEFRRLLDRVAQVEWVARPYGLEADQLSIDEDVDAPSFDERGAHTVYDLDTAEPDLDIAEATANGLTTRRGRALATGQIPIIDTYATGPSLWLGAVPEREANDSLTHHTRAVPKTLKDMHRHLASLVNGDDGWPERLLVFQALRRALLRESVLLRLLPERADRDESSWGDLLVGSFFNPLPGQRESMADRIAIFLEDLQAASGSVLERGTARHNVYDATRLRDQQFVALVTGSTKRDTRERIFGGFNSPLLPEILICTSVGQEGIDLHRHCRHVVHYDLAWNPAVLEQRTGRTDRIGSKTFRERDRVTDDASAEGPFLEIAVPFLAGTYDERMYEELRLRAQTFEVLTGGDLAADVPEMSDDSDDPEGTPTGLRLVALPDDMVGELRVDLSVWRAGQR